MANYGHELQFGVFITPQSQDPEAVVELAQLAERVRLDLVTFQDHPYQPRFLDTWTLLSWVAGRTERIHLAPNVANLPLRSPAVLARAAASLDLLSGGRLALGLGAGTFWEAIAAMGGRRLTPGESVEALDEAIDVIRAIWDTTAARSLRFAGEHYRLEGARPGPVPAHDIPIWVGAYKPRMLRLIGRRADGWIPTLAYLEGGVADLEEMNKYIDEGAAQAGRDPRAVRRFLNIGGRFAPSGRGLFDGPPEAWAEQIAAIALTYGVSGFILAADDAASIELYASEVVPAARTLIAAERARSGVTSDPGAGLVH